jgi:hypothetical protein
MLEQVPAKGPRPRDLFALEATTTRPGDQPVPRAKTAAVDLDNLGPVPVQVLIGGNRQPGIAAAAAWRTAIDGPPPD